MRAANLALHAAESLVESGKSVKPSKIMALSIEFEKFLLGKPIKKKRKKRKSAEILRLVPNESDSVQPEQV
jgi:hypothetical protein